MSDVGDGFELSLRVCSVILQSGVKSSYKPTQAIFLGLVKRVEP